MSRDPRARWYSQFGQDRFLDERVFRGRRGGVFVEAGAYDGVAGSNTAFLERQRGWTGLLIEPSPGLAAACREARTSPCLEVALATGAGTAPFIEVREGYRMMSGLQSTYDRRLLAKVRANPAHREQVIEVPTRRLDEVLGEARLGPVDLVCLDLEGAELAVLEDFPFDAWPVPVWCVENNLRSRALPLLFAAHGYRRAAVLGVDEIWVRRDRHRDDP